METPLAFISYDFKVNEAERVRFIGEIGSCSRPFNVDDWSVKPMSPRNEWDKVVHGKIGRCDFMIVLVSSGMETGQVAEEIVQAKRSNVPFFGVYVEDDATGIELPPGLPANRIIPMDWERIASAVSQVTKEGKHHVFA